MHLWSYSLWLYMLLTSPAPTCTYYDFIYIFMINDCILEKMLQIMIKNCYMNYTDHYRFERQFHVYLRQIFGKLMLIFFWNFDRIHWRKGYHMKISKCYAFSFILQICFVCKNDGFPSMANALYFSPTKLEDSKYILDSTEYKLFRMLNLIKWDSYNFLCLYCINIRSISLFSGNWKW